MARAPRAWHLRALGHAAHHANAEPSEHEAAYALLMRDGEELIVLFVGGTKRRQNANIKEARFLLDEYRARKAAKR